MTIESASLPYVFPQLGDGFLVLQEPRGERAQQSRSGTQRGGGL